MVHLAVQQNDESGSPITWGDPVTDEQYAARRRSAVNWPGRFSR
jgi:hypothetical protein